MSALCGKCIEYHGDNAITLCSPHAEAEAMRDVLARLVGAWGTPDEVFAMAAACSILARIGSNRLD